MTTNDWLPMEIAPKDGREILAWRRDLGVLLVQWTSMVEFMSDREIEESGLDEVTTETEDWFFADFVAGGRLEGSEAPTHWMPLPDGPQREAGEG